MKTRVINIGNSKGIRIPKVLLQQAQLEQEVILEVKEEGILIRPEKKKKVAREGWDLRMKEAQDLGKNLRDRHDLAKQVQDMLERMKQMKSKMLHDEQELERLQSSVIEGFRQLELDLSKQLQQVISRENLHLAKDEDVPEAYRRQVEEYYKALSKKN